MSTLLYRNTTKTITKWGKKEKFLVNWPNGAIFSQNISFEKTGYSSSEPANLAL